MSRLPKNSIHLLKATMPVKMCMENTSRALTRALKSLKDDDDKVTYLLEVKWLCELLLKKEKQKEN